MRILRSKRTSETPIRNTITELRNKLMLRTITFFPPNLNALTSLRNTEDILKSATGVRRQRPHQLSGNGTQLARSGIDGMTTHGTIGAHPREDSPPTDGLGIRVSGITTAGYSSTMENTGIDSKVESGSDTVKPSQLSQRLQLDQRFADLSINSKNGASQPHSDPRDSQDAESELVEKLPTICGKTEQPVSSSVESLST